VGLGGPGLVDLGRVQTLDLGVQLLVGLLECLVGGVLAGRHGVLVVQQAGTEGVGQHVDCHLRPSDVLGGVRTGAVGLGGAEVDDDLLGDGADGVVAGDDLRQGDADHVGVEVLDHVGPLLRTVTVGVAVSPDAVEQRVAVLVGETLELRLGAERLGAGLRHVAGRTDGLCLVVLVAGHVYSELFVCVFHVGLRGLLHYSIYSKTCQYTCAYIYLKTTLCYNKITILIPTEEGSMSTIDQQFIEYIVKSVVGNPDDVVVERIIDEKGVLLTLTVNPEDLGRVIGKRGVTAQSLRTLLRALGTKNNARYNLKIVNNDGQVGATYSSDETSSDNSADSATPVVTVTESIAVDNVTDEPVDNASAYTKKTRAELAELDDLDI
jgi:predicted RNA-binding protein YlqC (UPF0109 family)